MAAWKAAWLVAVKVFEVVDEKVVKLDMWMVEAMVTWRVKQVADCSAKKKVVTMTDRLTFLWALLWEIELVVMCWAVGCKLGLLDGTLEGWSVGWSEGPKFG